MISIGINPTLVSFGSASISWHGLFTVLGLVGSALLSLRLARKSGISDAVIYTILLWAIPSGLVVSRLFHVLDNLSYYSADPAKIIAVWDGGLSLYGALLGGIVAGVICIKVNRFPLGTLADIAAPSMILGQAIGRVGCVINGDAYGTPTSLPWGFVYTHPDAYAPPGIAGHPAAVYEIIWDLLVFAALLRLRGQLKPEGSLLLVYLALYSFGRFFISWVRVEPPLLGPLHQAHIISIVLFAIAVALLIRNKTRWVKPAFG